MSSSRTIQLLAKASRLPVELQQVFDGLFLQGKSEATLERDLGLSPAAFRERRGQLIRQLKSAKAS